MGFVELKMKILEKLWEEGRPMRPKDVAQRIGLKVSATTMYLLRLKREGHASTPRNGSYAITDLGKEAIGIPKMDKTHAAKMLNDLPVDKAFHFYTDINQHLGIYANSLSDFCDKIQKVDVKSIEFHAARKDFENWFQGLGDVGLAKRISTIRNMNLNGEDLRKKVHDAAKLRLQELKRL